MTHPKNVLFLCTGNSARSILAEALLNHLSHGRMRAYSAGSFPAGAVNPGAVQILAEKGMETEGLHSKSWDVFAAKDAPEMDLVVTVCDAAANEPCPYWPGAPLRAHWGLPDPAAAKGHAKAAAFAQAYSVIKARVQALLDLNLDDITTEKLQQIGAIGGEAGD